MSGPRAIPPLREIRFRTSRAGGPGGQNVNKVETRVEALWDLEASEIPEETKIRLRLALAPRLSAEGAIRVVSQRHRTQTRNREAAVERLRELVAAALAPRRVRRPTKATAASRATRLEAKKRRGAVKRERRWRESE